MLFTAATITLTVAATAHAEQNGTWFGNNVYSEAAIASWPEHPERYDIFVVDGVGSLWQIRVTSGPLREEDWLELPRRTIGGEPLAITGKPAVVTWDDGKIDLFARGRDDDALWHRLFDGKEWLPWESLGGVLANDPVAVRREEVDATLAFKNAGYIDVFVRGTDNVLYLREYGGKWTKFQRLGDRIAGAPKVVSWGKGRVDIVARSTDGVLVHAFSDPAYARDEWSPFQVIPGSGGLQTFDPDVVTEEPNRIDVFAVHQDGSLWQLTLLDGQWSPTLSIGGALASGPTVVSWAGRLDVFARGRDGTLQHIFFDTGWSKWRARGENVGQRPAAVASEDNRLEVIIVDENRNIYRKRYDGTWSP